MFCLVRVGSSFKQHSDNAGVVRAAAHNKRRRAVPPCFGNVQRNRAVYEVHCRDRLGQQVDHRALQTLQAGQVEREAKAKIRFSSHLISRRGLQASGVNKHMNFAVAVIAQGS